jgi:hypothetical protein
MGIVELQLNDFGLPAYFELTSSEVVLVVGTSEALYVLQQLWAMELEQNIFQGGWELFPNKDQRTKSQLTQECQPERIVSSHVFSTNVIDHLRGHVLSSCQHKGADPLMDEEMLQQLKVIQDTHITFMETQWCERSYFRLSAALVGKMCVGMP